MPQRPYFPLADRRSHRCAQKRKRKDLAISRRYGLVKVLRP
jgi:hypothetical protein